MKKKISLIIPALSKNSFVEDLIINVLNWSMFPNEIIIINSSKNNYLIKKDLLEKLKKNNIFLKIINKKNLYPGAARNFGIKYSSSQFILFLDINTLPSDRIGLRIILIS